MLKQTTRRQVSKAYVNTAKSIDAVEDLARVSPRQLRFVSQLNEILIEIDPARRFDIETIEDWCVLHGNLEHIYHNHDVAPESRPRIEKVIGSGYQLEAAHLAHLLSKSSTIELFADNYEAWCIHWFGRPTVDDEEDMKDEVVRIWNSWRAL